MPPLPGPAVPYPHSDQVAFLPGLTADADTAAGVFDLDGAPFEHPWNTDRDESFASTRHCISDHRILWAGFTTN